MDAAVMTIEQFGQWMAQQPPEEADQLGSMLRKLTTIEQPADVLALAKPSDGPYGSWVGWNF